VVISRRSSMLDESSSCCVHTRAVGRLSRMDDQHVGTGQLLRDEVVPARGGGAWLVEMGQRIRITDIEGSAIGDFVCFNANNLDERLSQARTKANQGRLMITTGHHLYTRDNNIIFTIDTDTYGVH